MITTITRPNGSRQHVQIDWLVRHKSAVKEVIHYRAHSVVGLLDNGTIFRTGWDNDQEDESSQWVRRYFPKAIFSDKLYEDWEDTMTFPGRTMYLRIWEEDIPLLTLMHMTLGGFGIFGIPHIKDRFKAYVIQFSLQGQVYDFANLVETVFGHRSVRFAPFVAFIHADRMPNLPYRQSTENWQAMIDQERTLEGKEAVNWTKLTPPSTD